MLQCSMMRPVSRRFSTGRRYDMILTRTEWALRFATTYLDLRDGGIELNALQGWGEELWARCGHLDPAEVARRQFGTGAAPSVQDALAERRATYDDG
jgi:hypothetical protein